MAPPQQPKKSYGLFIFGCILLIVVDFLWTLSSVLVQKLLDEFYNKPIIITYCSTSVFALYVPVFYSSNWLRTLFYSCRIRRNLRERYENDDNFNMATETTSLITGVEKTNSSNSLPYTDHSTHRPIAPNSSSSYDEHDSLGYSNSNDKMDHGPPMHSISARIDYDMDHLDAVPAEKDSQLYSDIRSYKVLYNERGSKVFWHNFKTALVLGPLWYTMNVTYNSALKMVSVSTNTILSTTAGFFVLLIGLIVFCVPVRKLHLFCVVLAIFGSFLVVVLGANEDEADPDQPRTLFDKIVGPSLCLLSAFLYGLYSVVIEYFTDKEKPLEEQKDSVAKQRKEAEEEEKMEQQLALHDAQSLFLGPSLHSGALSRTHSINSKSDSISVHIDNHLTRTSSDIGEGFDTLDALHSHSSDNNNYTNHPFSSDHAHVHAMTNENITAVAHADTGVQVLDSDQNFGFGVCAEQRLVERIRRDPSASLDEIEMVLDESDEEEDPNNLEPPLSNFDPNDPKLITGLLFGCVGLINLVFAWPFIGLFHWTGFETLQFPDSRAIPMLVMNSLLGAAASDFLWANAVILTSPIIATLTIPGTIPIAMCYETFFLHKPLSLYAVLGSILIVAASSVVTIHQYNEDKTYDKMTKAMLERREEKKQKEKAQRLQYKARQQQLQSLAQATRATTHRRNNSNGGQDDLLADKTQPRPIARAELE